MRMAVPTEYQVTCGDDDKVIIYLTQDKKWVAFRSNKRSCMDWSNGQWTKLGAELSRYDTAEQCYEAIFGQEVLIL